MRRWSVGTEHHARWSRWIAVLAVAVGVTVVGSPTMANAREVSPSAARADVPTATGLSPSSGPVAGGTAVTLTGTNFVPGSTDIVVAFTSGGQVRIPASDVRVDSTGTAASFTTVAHPRAAGGQAGFFPTTACRSAGDAAGVHVRAGDTAAASDGDWTVSVVGAGRRGHGSHVDGHQLRAGQH